MRAPAGRVSRITHAPAAAHRCGAARPDRRARPAGVAVRAPDARVRDVAARTCMPMHAAVAGRGAAGPARSAAAGAATGCDVRPSRPEGHAAAPVRGPGRAPASSSPTYTGRRMRVVTAGTFFDTLDRARQRAVGVADLGVPRVRRHAARHVPARHRARVGRRPRGASSHRSDRGETWELRHLGLPERWLDGVTGRDPLASSSPSSTPGELTATVLWTDRSDPSRPWVNQETQGLLPMRSYHTTSTDGGYHWSDAAPDRPAPSLGLDDRARCCVLRRWRAGPAVRALEGLRRPERRACRARCSGCRTTTARPGRGRRGRRRPAQRDASSGTSASRGHPETGELVAMFWTFDRDAGARPRDPHRVGLARRPRLDEPQPTTARRPALPADRDRRRRAWSRRTPTGASRPGIRVVRSDDFGRTWDMGSEVEVYGSSAGTEAAAEGASQARLLERDGRVAVRPSAWRLAAGQGEVFVVFYGGSGRPAALAGRGWRCDRRDPTNSSDHAPGGAEPDAHHEASSRASSATTSPRRGAGGTARGLHSTWYEYSFDTFHTDEGIDGYTMQNANVRDGAAMVDVLHDVYAPQLIGEDPTRERGLWHKLRRLNRHAYNLSDGVAGAIDVALWDIRGKVGEPADREDARPGPREDPGIPTASSIRAHARAGLRGGAERVQEAGYHGLQDPVLGRARRDIPRYRAAREAVGDDFPLMQDAAGMYTLHAGARGRARSSATSTTTGSRSRSRTATCSSSSA